MDNGEPSSILQPLAGQPGRLSTPSAAAAETTTGLAATKARTAFAAAKA